MPYKFQIEKALFGEFVLAKPNWLYCRYNATSILKKLDTYNFPTSSAGYSWPPCGSEGAAGAGLLVALDHGSSHLLAFSRQILRGAEVYGRQNCVSFHLDIFVSFKMILSESLQSHP